MIWEGYRITHTSSLKKVKNPIVKIRSFRCLKSMIHDQFFELIPGKLNAFLRGFQTNKPMLPFITHTLRDLVFDYFGRNILNDVLKKKSNCII